MARCRAILFMIITVQMTCMSSIAAESNQFSDFPPEVNDALHYFLGLIDHGDEIHFDSHRLESIIDFMGSTQSHDAIYHADTSFGVPSAFHRFSVDACLRRIVDYTFDSNIPSFFFWPSSLRLSRWTRVEGGDEQFARMQAASRQLTAPFVLRGAEHITITPDQHTGAYYSYDVDKVIILSPCRQGQVILNIYKQQAPSAVGRRGWVLGEDDEWSYLYTQDKGLNLKGLGWAKTYMYDSLGVTVYYQPDLAQDRIVCGVFSWVKAGWARINVVQSNHIHDGLVRVALAFKAIMEDPNLPPPSTLAETFSKSKDLPTPVLREYVGTYLVGLKKRIAACSDIWKNVADDFDDRELLDQMSRDELYAVVALDYFKKILGRNPVMDSHPF